MEGEEGKEEEGVIRPRWVQVTGMGKVLVVAITPHAAPCRRLYRRLHPRVRRPAVIITKTAAHLTSSPQTATSTPQPRVVVSYTGLTI